MDATTTTSRVENASEPFANTATKVQPEPIFEESGKDLFRDDCIELLHRAGLRPTRQRLMLAECLFSRGGRHVTAEMLHAEAVAADMQISMATVYNTLNLLTDAGLLRQIGVDGSKSFFDTNPTTHHHFFVDHEDRLFDVPGPGVAIDQLLQPLPGHEISRVDIVIHLRRKQV